ncbi:MAG: glycosyltransferase family 2 protein [Bacillota bacterium]|nr:glycosyltransferase family 2 protein [Bacillota bacterium]
MSISVSVVVPVFNCENTIVDLFHDLEAQSFTDFEVVFVDDGSRDNTLNLLKELSSRHTVKTKVISQTNAGVSAARNAGIRAAAGDCLVFVDADDRISPAFLSTLYDCMTKNDADLAIARFSMKGIDSSQNSHVYTMEENDVLLRRYLYEPKKRISIFTLMVKRELLLQNKMLFNSGHDYGEDRHFVWRLLVEAKRIACTDANLYYYQFNPSSAMQKFSGKRFHTYKLAKRLIPFFKKKAPEFALEFEKYGPARTMWSVVWQAAIMLDWENFQRILKDQPVRQEMRNLKGFPDLRVRLTKALYLLSPRLYFFVIHSLRKRIASSARGEAV